MAAPAFGDLGKGAKDLFEKNYKFGLLNFDFKTKTSNDVDVNINGVHNRDLDSFTPSLEFKMKPFKGYTSKTRIDSKWVLSNDLEMSGVLHPNLKHNLVTKIEAASGRKGMVSKHNFANEMVNFNTDFDFKSKYPTTTAALVLSPCCKYAFGAQCVADVENMKLNKHILSAQYKIPEFQACAALTDLNVVGLSVFHTQDKVDVGFKMGWNKKDGSTSYAVGFGMRPCPKSAIKAKVDQDSQIGLSYGMKVSSELTLTLCAMLNGKNLDAGGHKFGLSVEYST